MKRHVLTLMMAAGLTACGSGGAEGGRVTTATQRFDGSQAYALLERQVEFGPRVPGSPGHAAQLAWMDAYLRERADTVLLQSFPHATSAGDTVLMTNVLAQYVPDMPERILLVAHWDTRPTADMESEPERRAQPIIGANDGASGVAVLLQLAEVLSSHSPPVGVDLLFVDGEDYGPGEMYLGSTYFAANLPAGYRPLYAIVVDMVGDENPVFPIEGYSQEMAPEVVERVWRLAEEIGYGNVFRRAVGQPISDDHIPLNRAGIRAIDIIDFDYGPGNAYWHTLDDDLSRTSAKGLEAVGQVLATLIYRGG